MISLDGQLNPVLSRL